MYTSLPLSYCFVLQSVTPWINIPNNIPHTLKTQDKNVENFSFLSGSHCVMKIQFGQIDPKYLR